MCEINSHGGIIIMQKILDICLQNGAEMAEAGEFTKRAFLNGRIDLSQAESIIDIINSKTEKETMASINQLNGFLSEDINRIRQKIINVMVNIEVNIDYPEYDTEEVTQTQAKNMLEEVKGDLEKLQKTFYNGKIIKEGIKIAIIGKPNAGKSSLLNALLKEKRAIVTQYAGTTRDTIEEFLNIDGIPFKIVDTAGIREAEDEVEKIGIEKSRQMADSADLVIGIFDLTSDLNDEDDEIIRILKEKKSIIVLNKIDLLEKDFKINKKILNLNKKIIKISALEQTGIDELNSEIINLFKLNEINFDSEIIVTNARHKNLINKALENTNEALNVIEDNMPIDIIAVYIKEILENLGLITGENVSEDIINEVFSKFCLGK